MGHALAPEGRCAGQHPDVFSHIKDLQFEAKPDGPDAAFARRLQEALGGRWGELTVANQYLFQGWGCRLPGKYRDLLLDVGTEEMAHVEMICTMIARLLRDAPLSVQEAAGQDDPMLAAVYGGSLPAHTIGAGGGPLPVDSSGVPWSGSYVTASGSLLADFHVNVTAEAGPAAVGAAVPHDRRPRCEADAPLPARPRHRTPEGLAGRDRAA
jgi:Mn-containing catalase